ncbi:MAG: hypothetical protein NZM00_13275 [Anaerolinea sp.]|nr:hypothetical protein [Anaerolinea sp.]
MTTGSDSEGDIIGGKWAWSILAWELNRAYFGSLAEIPQESVVVALQGQGMGQLAV